MNRSEALRNGLRKYEGSRPCQKDPRHGNLRYTTSGACVACSLKKSRDAYKRGQRAHRISTLPIPDHPVPRSAPIEGKYFTGERCKRGHLYWRYASCGLCVLCAKQASSGAYIKQHALNVINAFRSLGPATVVWTDREPPAGLPEIDRRGIGANRVTAAPCFIRYPDTPGMQDLCKALGMVPIDEYVRNL